MFVRKNSKNKKFRQIQTKISHYFERKIKFKSRQKKRSSLKENINKNKYTLNRKCS